MCGHLPESRKKCKKVASAMLDMFGGKICIYLTKHYSILSVTP